MNQERKLKSWARLLQDTRQFMEQRGFLEVSTPYLVPAGAFEASIDPLEAHFIGGKQQLHTSPEIEMKVLLAESPLPIYQIARCFRDDPPSPIHSREFTMLEFYRPGVNYEGILTATKALIETLAKGPLPWRRHSVAALFQELGIDLAATKTADELRAAIRKTAVCEVSDTDDWSDLFFRVVLKKIEPMLPKEIPVILDQYPLEVSPLSASCNANQFAERFEIYWQGMELCNGCTELTDKAELLRRFEKQNAQRAVRGVAAHPLPERLLRALDLGLPQCAGVAIGLDRLFLSLAKDRGEDLHQLPWSPSSGT